MDVILPWGHTTLPVRLPDGWRMLGPYRPSELKAIVDVESACESALACPINSKPLGTRNLKDKRALLVVDDCSRPTPVHAFIRPLIRALLRSGLDASSIEILFALGVHRPMTQEEAETKVGKQTLLIHRWHNHNAFDLNRLVHLGTTSAGTPIWLNRLLTEFDLILTLGTIEPHMLVGFGGGSKMIIPGCAGAETIGQAHLRGVAASKFNYVGVAAELSPMRTDIEDGVEKLRKEIFAVNVILNGDKEVAAILCGEPREVLRQGSDFVRKHALTSPPTQADVVIVNSAPLDADLRQSLKCIGNTIAACRSGGLMLGFLRCANGLGDMPLPSWTLPYPIARPLARFARSITMLRAINLLRHGDPIEQRFLAHAGMQMLRRNHLWFFNETLPPNTGRKLGVFKQFRDVQTMLKHAVRKFGSECTVSVFPLGGFSYVSG